MMNMIGFSEGEAERAFGRETVSRLAARIALPLVGAIVIPLVVACSDPIIRVARESVGLLNEGCDILSQVRSQPGAEFAHSRLKRWLEATEDLGDRKQKLGVMDEKKLERYQDEWNEEWRDKFAEAFSRFNEEVSRIEGNTQEGLDVRLYEPSGDLRPIVKEILAMAYAGRENILGKRP